MDAMEQLRAKRISNFKNVITGNGKVEFIPHYGNYWSWKFCDAGYKLSEVLYDYDKITDSVAQFLDRYSMDSLSDVGLRNLVQVTSQLKPTKPYLINDDTYSISIEDQVYMEADEYDELIANPKKYLWEKFLPRKFSVFQNEKNSVDFRDFVMRFMEYGGKNAELNNLVLSHGIPTFASNEFGMFASGFEYLSGSFRGMRGISLDMRRIPDKVEAAIEAIEEAFFNDQRRVAMNLPEGTNPDVCVDQNVAMLGHVMLSPKQFERFYWPGLKKTMDYLVEKNKLGFIFCEGACMRFKDFLQEFPKDQVAILSELDDPYELKKALPNMVIASGPDSDLLGSGTPEENVAYAKKLIEDLGGEDHRFIFAPRKMVSFPTDCKRENLLAICKYLDNLRF